MTGDELITSFVRFFEERGHLLLPSLPLIPQDDPSLLFVIAGMQQMIPFFVGQTKPPAPRLVSVQKCLRTLDIEEVGDEQHLTYFEMLGNFSVGDYFVSEALHFTWEYLTEVLRLDPGRLWATIYPGDELAGKTWLEIGLPPERIVEDPSNWWERPGLAGPAGPDSEVHFDRGIEYGCGRAGCSPLDEDCHRFMEIWNNVFMQSFVNEKGEVLRELASKNIDTGQGFERLLMVVQGKETVYETDVFQPILDSVASTVGTVYKQDEAVDRSLRIIADHCRAFTMAVVDGGVPGNEGRGYVLRRLVRRALLRGRLLGIEKPFLVRPVETVIEIMKPRYPEVSARRSAIVDTVRREEERFAETLSRALPRAIELMEAAAANGGVVSGSDAFRLHDTFGLPLELIREMASERNVDVDMSAFEAELRNQQQRGRAGRAATHQTTDLESLAVLSDRIGPTEFVGYTECETEARVVGLVADGRLVEELDGDAEGEVVLDRTPFYAESGGQVGDTGQLVWPEGRFAVLDTQRPYGGIIVHKGRLVEGSLPTGTSVTAQVDEARRNAIRPHHSATHLLHLALHEVLGPEATQAGSLVAPERLRFDFRWPEPVGEERLERIQDRINQLVFQSQPVVTRELAYDDAVREGAMALFGEKYGDRVRVVSMGPSKELCGGTHVDETADIGLVVITSESGIGSGIRRIEALAGQAAYDHLRAVERSLAAVSAALGVPSDRAAERAGEVMAQLRDTERRLGRMADQVTAQRAGELAGTAESLDGAGKLLIRRVDAEQVEDLHRLTLASLKSLGSGVVVVGSVIDGRPHFAAAVSQDLNDRGVDAREIARRVGRMVGGGAGGSPAFAQGGGRDAQAIDSGLNDAREFLRASVAGEATPS